MTTATSTTAPAATPARRPLAAGLLVAMLGAALNLALGAIGATLLGMTFQAPQPPPDGPVVAIQIPMFALATLLPVAIGTLVAWAIGRRSRRGATAFIGFGAVLAVASATLPFTLPLTQTAALWMTGTHLVAATTFVLASRRAIE